MLHLDDWEHCEDLYNRSIGKQNFIWGSPKSKNIEYKVEHPIFLKEKMGNPKYLMLFFSKNIFRINKVKSDIRRIINKKFIENNISIPFPQMDLNLKSNYTEPLKKN